MKNFKTFQLVFSLFFTAFTSVYCHAQPTSYRFRFQEGSPSEGKACIPVPSDCRYEPLVASGPTDTSAPEYGYDLIPGTAESGDAFCFSVRIPDGDYLVTALLGSKNKEGCTTIRTESRRSYIENYPTLAGQFHPVQFLVHKRSPYIHDTEQVKIKPRERDKLDWDEKLTFEINGTAPQLAELHIEPAPAHTTLFLCGNSTVVNQDREPWASWGQMIPRFFTSNVCIANYAESGESASSFMASNRLKKVLSLVKPGDYVFIEFGHNDEKIKGPDKGPFTSFTQEMRFFVTETRKHGATPVLITPTERRSFNAEGVWVPTHGEYPDATRQLAQEEETALIDLTAMTRTLYEALGKEGSKKALVHYPAHTFPGQSAALADNTHFNTYGACEIAKCVLQGIRTNKLKISDEIKDFTHFDPATPDDINRFVWIPSPFFELEKPEGN